MSHRGGRRYFNGNGNRGNQNPPPPNGWPRRNQSFGAPTMMGPPNNAAEALLVSALAAVQQDAHQRRHSLPEFPVNFNQPPWQNQPARPLMGNMARNSTSNIPDVVDLTQTSSASDSESGPQNRNNRKRQHGRDEQPDAPVTKQIRRDADGFMRLSQQIDSYARQHAQSDDMLQRKMNLRSALQNSIWQRYPHATVHLVGSTWNGFASGSSDVDLCVVVEKGREVDKNNSIKYLRVIQRLIQKINALKKIELIRARVPILTFNDMVSGCECDMNINNETGIRNTHLLRTYSKMDDRVRPLVLAVKNWAKTRKINDAKTGMLSSYSLVLMVVHYLQVGCQPPVLKSLRKHYGEHFAENSDVDQLPSFEPADFIPCNESENNASIGKLFAGFLHYYDTYHWGTHAISVREAMSIPRSSSVHFKDKYICIEEPFELYNTARSVYDLGNFNTIKREFKRANARLKQIENPPYEYIL